MAKYRGSCHCKAIIFEVEANEDAEIEKCNCSICTMSGYLHLIVPEKNFSLFYSEVRPRIRIQKQLKRVYQYYDTILKLEHARMHDTRGLA